MEHFIKLPVNVNWFMFATGILELAAGVQELLRKHPLLAVCYVCYGIAALALSAVRGS